MKNKYKNLVRNYLACFSATTKILSVDSERSALAQKIDFTSTGKAKYTPPRSAGELAPFDDTFKYTLNDGHSAEADWPAPVTVTITVNTP